MQATRTLLPVVYGYKLSNAVEKSKDATLCEDSRQENAGQA
jgi:hypothetical protein